MEQCNARDIAYAFRIKLNGSKLGILLPENICKFEPIFYPDRSNIHIHINLHLQPQTQPLSCTAGTVCHQQQIWWVNTAQRWEMVRRLLMAINKAIVYRYFFISMLNK